MYNVYMINQTTYNKYIVQYIYKINDYLLGKLPGEDFSHHRFWNRPILGEVEHVKDLGNDGVIIFGRDSQEKKASEQQERGVTRQERGQDQLSMSTF